jgi:hypothetical protein
MILDVQRDRPRRNRQRRRHQPEVVLDHHHPRPVRRRPTRGTTRQARHDQDQDQYRESARPAPTPPRAPASTRRSRHPRYIGTTNTTLSRPARRRESQVARTQQRPAFQAANSIVNRTIGRSDRVDLPTKGLAPRRYAPTHDRCAYERPCAPRTSSAFPGIAHRCPLSRCYATSAPCTEGHASRAPERASPNLALEVSQFGGTGTFASWPIDTSGEAIPQERREHA